MTTLGEIVLLLFLTLLMGLPLNSVIPTLSYTYILHKDDNHIISNMVHQSILLCLQKMLIKFSTRVVGIIVDR